MNECCCFENFHCGRNRNSFKLQILTLDFQTGICLWRAHYQLKTFNGSIIHTLSDIDGYSEFPGLFPGFYSLVQAAPPSNYQAHPHRWNIQVDNAGLIWIDGVEKSSITVYNALLSANQS